MPAPLRGLLRSVPLSGAPAPDQYSGTAVADSSSSDGGASVNLQACLALAEAAVESASTELGVAGFGEAADFADLAEELSRRVEHLQLLAAAAVERTRTAAINTAAVNTAGPASKTTGWTTGWGADPAPNPRQRLRLPRAQRPGRGRWIRPMTDAGTPRSSCGSG